MRGGILNHISERDVMAYKPLLNALMSGCNEIHTSFNTGERLVIMLIHRSQYSLTYIPSLRCSR